MNHEPSQDRDAVADRHLDLLLTEELGEQTAPDVAERTVAALSRPAPRARSWLQVACALLGLA